MGWWLGKTLLRRNLWKWSSSNLIWRQRVHQRNYQREYNHCVGCQQLFVAFSLHYVCMSAALLLSSLADRKTFSSSTECSGGRNAVVWYSSNLWMCLLSMLWTSICKICRWCDCFPKRKLLIIARRSSHYLHFEFAKLPHHFVRGFFQI